MLSVRWLLCWTRRWVMTGIKSVDKEDVNGCLGIVEGSTRIWLVQDQIISLLQQRQPRRWAEPEGSEVLLRQQCCSDPNLNFWKNLFNSKSFQLFLSFGLPCSVEPLQSPVRKPTVPGWRQFFGQDHWRSRQSQRQNCCVPPALARLPLQPNYNRITGNKHNQAHCWRTRGGAETEREEGHAAKGKKKNKGMWQTQSGHEGKLKGQTGDIFY